MRDSIQQFNDNGTTITGSTSYDGGTTTWDGGTTSFETMYGVQKWIKFNSDLVSPFWVTNKGVIAGYGTGDSASYQLEAESLVGGTITYSLIYGSLPHGLSLSSSGLITGTVVDPSPAAELFTQNYFVVRATDNINGQVSDRGFEISINAATTFDTGLTTFDSATTTLDVA